MRMRRKRSTHSASSRCQACVDSSAPAQDVRLSGRASGDRIRVWQQVCERWRAARLARQQGQQLLGRARIPEELPLAIVAVMLAQELEVPGRLDAFGDYLHPQAP